MFLAALLLYTCTLSKGYLGDGIQFAMSIETGDFKELLVPNHMLYPMAGLGFYNIWQLFGWHGGALLPLQILSAIGGALIVALMYLVSVSIIKSRLKSLWIATLFGVMAGVWVYSTDSESVTVPLAMYMVLLYFLVTDGHLSSFKSPLIMGFLCFASVAVYEAGVLLVFPVIAGYLVADEMALRIRIRQIALFLTVSGALVIALYLSVATTVFQVRNWQGFHDWHFRMSSLGLWGRPTIASPARAWNAIIKTLGGYPGFDEPYWSTWLSEASSSQRAAWVVSELTISAGLLLSIFLLVKRRKYLLEQHRRVLAIASTWLVVYSAFAMYWVASDASFWVPALVPWWLLVGVALSTDPISEDVATDSRSRPSGKQLVAMVSVFTAVAVMSLIFSIVPKLRSDCPRQLAMSIAHGTNSSDLVITPGGGDLFLWIPYFAHRNTISVFHWILGTMAPSPWLLRPATDSPKIERRSKEEVFNEVATIAKEVRIRGGRVLLVGARPGTEWSSLADGVGLQKEDFSHLKTRPQWTVCGETVLEIYE